MRLGYMELLLFISGILKSLKALGTWLKVEVFPVPPPKVPKKVQLNYCLIYLYLFFQISRMTQICYISVMCVFCLLFYPFCILLVILLRLSTVNAEIWFLYSLWQSRIKSNSIHQICKCKGLPLVFYDLNCWNLTLFVFKFLRWDLNLRILIFNCKERIWIQCHFYVKYL